MRILDIIHDGFLQSLLAHSRLFPPLPFRLA